MAEFSFYHLSRQTMESALPRLLSKAIAGGWRSVVRVGSEERLSALDDHLWAFSDESFLPHGTDREADADAHPILITTEDRPAPRGRTILFVVDGASVQGDVAGYERVALVFDGRDPEAVGSARASWRAAREADHPVAYWQEGEDGGWERRA